MTESETRVAGPRHAADVTPVLQARGLTKRYGRVVAIDQWIRRVRT